VTLILTVVLILSLFAFQHVKAESNGTIYIRADGSLEGTDKIQCNGNVYTLTGNISFGIQVQKSYVVIDGAGYTIDGNGEEVGIDLSNGRGQDPSRTQINNITVKNLQIINCYSGIGNENTNNNTFIGNYVAGCDTGFWIIGSHNNTLTYNTIKDCVTGISINYGSSGNVIVENNIISSWSVWLSPAPMVDRNYWGDYLTRFPNAKEIDNSGVWDTPYSHGGAVIDYHPLVKPVVISSNGNPEVPGEQNPTIWIATTAAVVVGVGCVIYFVKSRKKAGED
jgi:parallel beta-helix repeat protein